MQWLRGDGYKVHRPVVFFLSDGQPTDGTAWRKPHAALTDRSQAPAAPNIIACGIGDAQAQTMVDVATRPEFAFVAKSGAGNFKVLAVCRGTSDHAWCDNWPHYDYWRHMPVAKHSGLDVLLCLSMNYPDDGGYATVNECLLKSGSTFTNVDGCTGSSVFVTGRTSTPDDPAFCGHDGSTYWHSNDYPGFDYTVCWRWR